ncbi:MAG: protein translocase subunit SecD [Kiritimatiellia bacterium]
MEKNAVWKWLLLVVLLAGSFAVVYPPSEKVKLGLDLQGGTSFTVEIDKSEIQKRIIEDEPDVDPETLPSRVARAASEARENALEVIRNRVDGLGIAEPVIYSSSAEGSERIVVQLPGVDKEKREAARESIESVAFLEFRLVHEKSAEWVEELFTDFKAPRGFKISDAGDFYIRDVENVKDEDMDQEFLDALHRFEPQPGCSFMLEKDSDASGRTIYRPYYISIRKQMTGDTIKNAGVDYHQITGAPSVNLEFDRQGARRFAKITRDYAPGGEKNRESDTGRQLAIILDGTLYSAPVIQTEIPNGRAEITGNFKVPEAMRLANVLKAGALPAPVKIIQTSTVDPSLGRDAINGGIRAGIVAFSAIVIFMLGYYLLAGLVADVSLVAEILLMPLGLIVTSGFLGLFSGQRFTGAAIGLPTLTLPGIAALILTMGMAVDANVLIYERIREELRAGKRLSSAIASGYERAFSVIFDANLTTLLTAVILFTFGSGPIRGFAVMLSAGIIVTMLVVLVFTRLWLNWLVDSFKVKTMKMLSFFGNTKIDFMRYRFVAATISLVIIAGTWTVVVKKGEANLAVDFAGGTSFLYGFKEKLPIDQIRAELTKINIDASLQYKADLIAEAEGGINEMLDVRVGENEGEAVKKLFESNFAGYELLQEEQVGGQIGDELRRKAIMAIIWSLLGIVLYLAFRFEFGYGVGAVVALAHDVLITVGIYCVLGKQISLPIVAALLTIVGYSVNDTIVVFDRIREDLKLVRGRSYKDIVNLSVNQTLSRTVLTSGTTLLSIIALMLFGGGSIFDFALTLFIGVTVGTYSSVYLATPVAMLWHREKPKAA